MKRLLALFALVCAVCAYAQTLTPNIGLQQPAASNWAQSIDYDLGLLDLLLSGNAPLPALNVTGNIAANNIVTTGSYQGAWSNATTYSKGQTVLYGTGIYVSLASMNLNNNPSTALASWSLFLPTGSISFTPENIANKGVANGYPGLDGSAKLPQANLPTIPLADIPTIPYTLTTGVGLTLGEQLRAAYSAAGVSNPQDLPPWQIIPAWAQTTNYVASQMVTAGTPANTHMYLETNGSCTSAGTGTGPTQLGNTSFSDGSPACVWYYEGDQAITSNDTSFNAPTITFTSGSVPFSGASLWYPMLYPSVFRVDGATPSQYSTGNYWKFWNENISATGTNNYGYHVCMDITDSKFGIALTNGSVPFGLELDGRQLSTQAQSVTGNLGWINFTYNFAAKHNVCLNAIKNGWDFAGVGTQSTGTVSAPGSGSNAPLAVFVYDSYDAGSSYGPFTSYGTLGTRISERMGWKAWHMGIGGTGLQNNGSANSLCTPYAPNYCYTYIQRIQDSANAAIIAQASVVIFNVSTNDVGGVSTEQTAVTNFLNAVRVINPTALIVGLGPASINPGSPTFAQTQALDSAGSAAFAAFADPAGPGLACYVPDANDSVPWITNTSWTSSYAPTSNFTLYINSSDNTHPLDAGTGYLAKRSSDGIANKCLPFVR